MKDDDDDAYDVGFLSELRFCFWNQTRLSVPWTLRARSSVWDLLLHRSRRDSERRWWTKGLGLDNTLTDDIIISLRWERRHHMFYNIGRLPPYSGNELSDVDRPGKSSRCSTIDTLGYDKIVYIKNNTHYYWEIEKTRGTEGENKRSSRGNVHV